MKFSPSDLRLLAELAALLRRVNPIPAAVLADAEAAGLRLAKTREPRLANPRSDVAWLLPLAWPPAPDFQPTGGRRQ